MNKKKIAVAGIIALALTGIGSGAALAATPAAPTSAPATSSPGSASTGTPEAPDTESATETPGSESATPNDGNDGGHADPEGVDVNNQGGANEK